MRPIKAIAIDIDGTLVAPEQEVTPRVRRAVAEAQERGILVMLATGRRYDSALPFAQALRLEGPIIVSGGAAVCHTPSGEMYYEDVLPAEGTAACTDLLCDYELQPLLRERHGAGHRLFLGPEHFDNEATAEYVRREVHGVVRLPHQHLRHTSDVLFAAGLSPDEDLLQRLALEVARIPGVVPMVLPPGPPSVLGSPVLDIFSAGTCKARALRFVSERFGFDLAETMAIGDGINDVDLLAAVGLPVAVGNAIPEVKALAQEVVSGVDEDGVAEAIEKLVLGETPSLGAASASPAVDPG